MNRSMEKDPDKKPEENFAARWSRRKVETACATQTVDAQQSGNPPSERGSDDTDNDAGQRAQGSKEVLTDEHMPPIDSLTEDSDFSGFLSPGVSERLRKQALRKLFGSAGFNIRDGLDDYDDDFRNFAALGDLITSDMRHQMELEEERKRKQDAAETQAQPEEATAEEEMPEDKTDQETDQSTDHQPDDGEPVDTDKKSS